MPYIPQSPWSTAKNGDTVHRAGCRFATTWYWPWDDEMISEAELPWRLGSFRACSLCLPQVAAAKEHTEKVISRIIEYRSTAAIIDDIPASLRAAAASATQVLLSPSPAPNDVAELTARLVALLEVLPPSQA